MSDIMLFGVLQMPCEMAMRDELSQMQFHQRAQQAVERIKELETMTEGQREIITDFADRLEKAQAGWVKANAGWEKSNEELFKCRLQSSQPQISKDEFAKLILWLLGENGEFPSKPITHPGEYQKNYWWRTELRKRWDALQSIPATKEEK